MTPDLLDDPDAIVGASGAGKSYTARKKVEQLLDAGRQTIVFDPTGVWYGLRSNAAGDGRGFDVPIFGGPHGDVPIGAGNGDAIAGILLEERVSAIIDLSDFEEADLRLFALDFLTRLRRRDRFNLHVVFDEADEFAPEKVPDDIGYQLVRKMVWVAKRGRVFGLVPTFITQRPADFAKAVLSQAQTIYFHQLIAPADQRPVVDYLKARADKATLDQVKASLAELQLGERWIYSPRRKILDRGFTPAIATFDSMAAPSAGQEKREPRTLAQLDVSKIRDALSVAPAVDLPIGADAAAMIASQRDRIVELEQLLDSERAERSQISQIGHRAHLALLGLATAALEESENIKGSLYGLLGIKDLATSPAALNGVAPSQGAGFGEDVAGEGFGRNSPATVSSNLAVDPPRSNDGKGAAGGEAGSSLPAERHRNTEVLAVSAETAAAGAGGRTQPVAVYHDHEVPAIIAEAAAGSRQSEGDGLPAAQESAPPALGKLARTFLYEMERRFPALLSWENWAVLIGRKAHGPQFSAARAQLRSADAIAETNAGVSAVRGDASRSPAGNPVEIWTAILPSMARAIFTTLVKDGDGTAAEIAARIDRQPSGPQWNSAIAQLRGNNLISDHTTELRLNRQYLGDL